MSKASILAKIITNILTGGRRTTAALTRDVLNDLTNESLNIKDGGLIVEQATGYNTTITPSDPKEFATKLYVDNTALKILHRADATGTVDVITATFSPVITSLTDKIICLIVASGANATTTPTFQPDANTPHVITKKGGFPLAANDIPSAGAVLILVYNLASTRWEYINCPGSSAQDLSSVLDVGNSMAGRYIKSPNAQNTFILDNILNNLYFSNGLGKTSNISQQAAATSIDHSDKIILDSPIINIAQGAASKMFRLDASKNLVASNYDETDFELLSNKATDLSSNDDIHYSTTKAVQDALNTAIEGVVSKADCKIATTANITLSGLQTIDAVLTIAGDRVLVKDQTDAKENGIYLSAIGAWTRALDANTGIELKGALVSIDEGAVNANTTWRQTKDAVTIGVTIIDWVQYAASTPDATATVKGKAKLYTSLGTNTDGGIDQATAKSNFDLKSDLSGATFTGAIAATNLSNTNTGDNPEDDFNLVCGLKSLYNY